MSATSPLWPVAADVLAAAGGLVLVTGRDPGAGAALRSRPGVDDAVVAGEASRPAVAAGAALGGRRAVVVLETRLVVPRVAQPLLVLTDAATVAEQALVAGWPVLQPSRAGDVGRLLHAAPARAVLRAAATVSLQDTSEPCDAGRRVWRRGSVATVVASGGAVDPMVAAARMLAGRRHDVTAVEVATLTEPGQRPLLGDGTLLVGTGAAAAPLLGGGWPEALFPVDVGGLSPRDAMHAVLAGIPAAPC